jgi:hypothetical protein
MAHIKNLKIFHEPVEYLQGETSIEISDGEADFDGNFEDNVLYYSGSKRASDGNFINQMSEHSSDSSLTCTGGYNNVPQVIVPGSVNDVTESTLKPPEHDKQFDVEGDTASTLVNDQEEPGPAGREDNQIGRVLARSQNVIIPEQSESSDEENTEATSAEHESGLHRSRNKSRTKSTKSVANQSVSTRTRSGRIIKKPVKLVVDSTKQKYDLGSVRIIMQMIKE